MRTPVGHLKITTSDVALLKIDFVSSSPKIIAVLNQPQILQDCQQQLLEYFDGKRKKFELKLDLAGTEFQNKVWQALQKIKFGQTASYKDIAKLINTPNGFRAVGMANNKNPIPIVVPCHRIIGANGDLVGYAGGLKIKKWLLDFETIPLNRK